MNAALADAFGALNGFLAFCIVVAGIFIGSNEIGGAGGFIAGFIIGGIVAVIVCGFLAIIVDIRDQLRTIAENSIVSTASAEPVMTGDRQDLEYGVPDHLKPAPKIYEDTH